MSRMSFSTQELPQKAPFSGCTPLIAAAGMVPVCHIFLTRMTLEGTQDCFQDTPQNNLPPKIRLFTNSILNRQTESHLRYTSRVYVGAPELQEVPSSGSSSSEECVEPDPVQSIIKQHTEDGPRKRVVGDEHQSKPSLEGGDFIGVMSSSPPAPDSDAGKSRFGNALDPRMPAQPLATPISLRTYFYRQIIFEHQSDSTWCGC